LIKVQSFRKSQNKLAYAYLLTPVGIAEKSALTARFLKRKMAEYEHLQAVIAALQIEVNGVQSSEDSARDLARNMEINHANRN